MRPRFAPLFVALALALVFAAPRAATAGFTETLPEGMFLIDESFAMSFVENAWNNASKRSPLIEDIDRYEPGGGLQGTIHPNASVRFGILINQLQYGILDELSLGVGIPVIIYNTVNPRLGWTPGDYQPQLGRPYSADDFWQWAASMGQPKPGRFDGNKGVPGDLVLGLRWRFSDRAAWFKEHEFAMALLVLGAVRTGRPADAEQIVATGTTLWDLHAQGELGFHLGMDKTFKEETDDRVTLGLDLFYEVFFPRELVTPTGTENPLLLNNAPYVGKHYTLDGGDFVGFQVQTDIVAWRGEARRTWITGDSDEKAAAMPPILKFSLAFRFTGLLQTQYTSDSPLWDYSKERLWRPGFKNYLFGTVSVSLLRVGVPLMLYAKFQNVSWIPGRNARAPDAIQFGMQIPLKFW